MGTATCSIIRYRPEWTRNATRHGKLHAKEYQSIIRSCQIVWEIRAASRDASTVAVSLLEFASSKRAITVSVLQALTVTIQVVDQTIALCIMIYNAIIMNCTMNQNATV